MGLKQRSLSNRGKALHNSDLFLYILHDYCYSVYLHIFPCSPSLSTSLPPRCSFYALTSITLFLTLTLPLSLPLFAPSLTSRWRWPRHAVCPKTGPPRARRRLIVGIYYILQLFLNILLYCYRYKTYTILIYTTMYVLCTHTNFAVVAVVV